MIVRTGRVGAAALLASTIVLALSACGGSNGDKENPTTAASTTTTPSGRPLPAAWYEDPDDDFVPTAVEEEIGTDPTVDECAKASGCGAEAAAALKANNTLLILDSSGSMAGKAGGGTTKLAAAKRALRGYVAGTPDSIALGFMVLGHKGSNGPSGKAASCAGVELLMPIGTAASRRFDSTLDTFKPTGYTPLAKALREARGAFDGKEGDANRIILVTDGVETCGGDPVAEARKLKQAGIDVTTDVVGFDVADPDEARRLRAIAEASGGTYSDARTASALNAYFKQALERYENLAKELTCVLNSAGKISVCRQQTNGKAMLYMLRAAGDAQRGGRREESDEIARLRRKMDAAVRERLHAEAAETQAKVDKLKREIEVARRRYEAAAG